jgi:hypothetical protein
MKELLPPRNSLPKSHYEARCMQVHGKNGAVL